VSVILVRIGTTPIGLAGIGFQHRCILPLWSRLEKDLVWLYASATKYSHILCDRQSSRRSQDRQAIFAP
jgi:hypothetical protein